MAIEAFVWEDYIIPSDVSGWLRAFVQVCYTDSYTIILIEAFV